MRKKKCACGHTNISHNHYRAGTDCAECACEKWDPEPSLWFRIKIFSKVITVPRAAGDKRYLRCPRCLAITAVITAGEYESIEHYCTFPRFRSN